jgi:predicted  nucleic acid-binding Zn-ribbon protein
MNRPILLIVCLSILLLACTGNEKENQRLTEELKMVREENSFLKAEIVGLQKQLDELNTKVREGQEGLQKRADEERDQMQEKSQDDRQALLKRPQGATKKKNEAGRRD